MADPATLTCAGCSPAHPISTDTDSMHDEMVQVTFKSGNARVQLAPVMCDAARANIAATIGRAVASALPPTTTTAAPPAHQPQAATWFAAHQPPKAGT